MKFPRLFIGFSLAINFGIANAQNVPTPPEMEQVDKNGVDLISGSSSLNVSLGSIALGDAKLEYISPFSNAGISNNIYGKLLRYVDDNNLKTYVSLQYDGYSKLFVKNTDGSFSAVRGKQEILKEASDGKSFTYTKSDGEVITFGKPGSEAGPLLYCLSNSSLSSDTCALLILNKLKPNGNFTSYEWQTYGGMYARVASISNNFGYKISFGYLINSNPTVSTQDDWNFVTDVYFFNLAASNNYVSHALISYVDKSSNTIKIQDVAGEVWQWSNAGSSDGQISVKYPSAQSYNLTYQPVVPDYTHKITYAYINGIKYKYDFNLSGNDGTTVVTNPDGGSYQIKYLKYTSKVGSAAFPVSLRDELGRSTSLNVVKSYLVNTITYPEGNSEVFSYDSRDNVSSITHKPKPGSNLSDKVETYTFPNTCDNPNTCNEPLSVVDARGSVTDYVYSPTHGGVISESFALNSDNIRLVKRFTYAQRYAWTLNSQGAFVKQSMPVWLVSKIQYCKNTATESGACKGGAADEVSVNYDYGNDSGPNNLNLKGVYISDNGVTIRRCYAYNSFGMNISETEPLANSGVCP